MAAQAFANYNPGLGYNPALTPGAGCNQNGFVPVGADPRLVVCIPQNTNGLETIDRGNYTAPARSPSIQRQRTTAVRGRISYDFGPATLSYTGGYRTTDESFDSALAPAYLFKNFANDVDTQSHELRINGGEAGGIQWQGGVFRFKDEIDEAIRLLLERPAIEDVVTHVVAAEEAERAFELAKASRASGKVLVATWPEESPA